MGTNSILLCKIVDHNDEQRSSDLEPLFGVQWPQAVKPGDVLEYRGVRYCFFDSREEGNGAGYHIFVEESVHVIDARDDVEVFTSDDCDLTGGEVL